MIKNQQNTCGDKLIFARESDKKEFVAYVIITKTFKTFKEALESNLLSKFGYDSSSIDEIINLLQNHYTKEAEKKYVVLIVEIEDDVTYKAIYEDILSF